MLREFNATKARNRGVWLALTIVVSYWLSLDLVGEIFLSRLDRELRSMILIIVGMFGLLLPFPVIRGYERFEARLFCARNGHKLRDGTDKSGRRYVWCERCYARIISEPKSTED